MRSYAICAAVLALCGFSSNVLLAQGQGQIVITDPTSLTFNVGGGPLTPQDVTVTLGPGQPIAIFEISAPPGVTVERLEAPFTHLPNKLRVSINPSIVPVGSTTSIGISGQGLRPANIALHVINPGQTTFSVSPSSVSFVQNGTAVPGAASVAVLSNSGTIPSYMTAITYTSGTAGWLSVSPAPGVASTSASVTLTPSTGGLTTGNYSATVTLTPTSGLAAVSIPVTLSVNQSTGTPLTVSPSSLTFTGTQATSQNIQVTSGTPVAFTAAVSSSIAGAVQVTSGGTTNTTIQVTANPLAVVAGTTGSIILTPAGGSGYSVTTIPVTINPGGVSTLIVNPTSLAFTAQIGSSNVARQSLSVTSSDQTQRQFQVTTSSTSNFLFVDNLFPVTPANVSVGVNLSAITQPGTYLGTLILTPLTGGGSPTFVQVTLNATQNVTVTPDPSSVTLSAGAGTAALVQRDVLLNSTIPNIAFTAATTTTSGGNWLTVGTSSGTLPSTLSIIANPTGLASGTYSGSVTVTVQGSTVATIPVTFTVTPAASLQLSPTSLTFNYETSSVSNPAPQQVSVTGGGANVAWNAAVVSSGSWLQINPTSGTTPGAINVSVLPSGLTAGTYTATISVSSSAVSNSPQTVTVTLNVTSPAVPLITSFQNAASFEQSLAVPGSITTIRGTDLGPVTGVSGQINGQFLSTSVADVEVTFDGIVAPLVYVSANQINTVVPFEVYGRTTTRLQVKYRNRLSRDLELRVQDTGPGIFTSNASGTGQASALNQNGSVNNSNNPESRGNVIVLYATGQGQTTPGGTTGLIMPPTDLRRPRESVTVRIGGQNAELLYAGSAPGLVAGAMQVNARIPSNSIIGPNVPVQIQVGTAVSQSNVTISVQ